jgi:N-acetylmuramoyl-L-alanine amidase
MFRSVIILFLVAFVALSQQCNPPTIVPRRDWGARAANTPTLARHPAPSVVIHHTVTSQCNSDADCRQQMRNMQNHHMNVNRWPDIGYNFCVGGTGIVYEGRGWNRVGTHAPGFNDRSIGICIIGTFTNTLPTNHALSNAQALIACGVRLGQIRSNYQLLGHRQASVSTNGKEIFMSQ